MVFSFIIKSNKQEFRQHILFQKDKHIDQVFISEQKLFEDADGVEWKENNHELVILDEYYEVLSIEKTKGGYFIKVIKDDLENELFAHYHKRSETNKNLAACFELLFHLDLTFNSKHLLKNLQERSADHRVTAVASFHPGYTSESIKPPAAQPVLAG